MIPTPSNKPLILGRSTEPGTALMVYQSSLPTCEKHGWDPAEELQLLFDGSEYAVRISARVIDAELSEFWG